MYYYNGAQRYEQFLQVGRHIGHLTHKIVSEMTYNVSSGTLSPNVGWLHGTAVERWSLTGELSLSCARPTDDG